MPRLRPSCAARTGRSPWSERGEDHEDLIAVVTGSKAERTWPATGHG
ncbi:MAG: hypothetical protein ACLP52_15415 [Streptosporangiaceae bacterium]